jgi:competence protein ComFC
VKIGSDLFSSAVSLFYPPACEICGISVSPKEYLCPACHAKAPRITRPFCEKCSEPFSGAMEGPFACGNCANQTLHFEAAISVYRARGIVRELIHDFKYKQRSHLRHLVAGWLSAVFADDRLQGRQFDLIVPVPLHPARQRQRGFNQAALIAGLIAPRAGSAVKPVLDRVRFTTTQTAFDRSERMKNLRDAFRLRHQADVRGLRVLLIDDVLTTGSTLSECARVLKEAGAVSVYAATAARA